ncbi:unnamed protein product [Calypogeia fissa]
MAVLQPVCSWRPAAAETSAAMAGTAGTAMEALGSKTSMQLTKSGSFEQFLGRQALVGVAPRFLKLGLRAEQQTGDGTQKQKLEVSRSHAQSAPTSAMSRRSLLSSVLLGSAMLSLPTGENSALAASSYREYIDRLDGYIFSYPSGWIQVRGAGADVFFRDPVNLDENVVVEFSSPSSSRYKSVEDLGTPDQAAQKVLKQKITEFMSTRIGVRRESKIVSANSRIGDDGRLYYDIEVDVKSYANTNELAVMPADRVAKLEWSRRYLSTLGVENNRLYELRLQAPEKALAQEGQDLRQIMNSFQLVKLDV